MKTSFSPLCSPSRRVRHCCTSQSAFAGGQAGGSGGIDTRSARPQVLDLRARVSYRDELLADSSRCADAGASLAHRSIARVA